MPAAPTLKPVHPLMEIPGTYAEYPLASSFIGRHIILVQRLGLIQSLTGLYADQFVSHCARDSFGGFRLAHAIGSLGEKQCAQFLRETHNR